ncbi:AAA family ATPase [Streptomyces beijiangensis]|uniref:AAA family ATPase n=1 Tax=Streptomyces beijiangensis TaxID=163361 RepID=A0A939JCE3_9ACTN|nr:AAA family ATPase [Streptomyces beijiangensis]MBO0510901.1 AAA family ATPase [Streptomyces beijiangensis]
MQRILVVGSTGAGKSTMARGIARRLGLPFHEMDALHFIGPDWQENPDLVEQVTGIVRGPDGWVFDSIGHPRVRDLLWEHADTVVWLDYSRHVVLARVLRRSLRRTLLRERIFGGNREGVAEWFRADHPVWWAMSQYNGRRTEILRRTRDPRFAPLRVIRYGSPRSVRRPADALL